MCKMEAPVYKGAVKCSEYHSKDASENSIVQVTDEGSITETSVNSLYDSTITPFYHIWSRERAK